MGKQARKTRQAQNKTKNDNEDKTSGSEDSSSETPLDNNKG